MATTPVIQPSSTSSTSSTGPLVWDKTGEHYFEVGVDHGVLYVSDGSGGYLPGVAWNGLTKVSEAPEGAEANKQYADNTVYLSLLSEEEFKATVEAFTYPDEFGQCDGSAEAAPGILIGQQERKTFGLAYRTKIGNDTKGSDLGYKINLIYNAQAAPSSRDYETVNDSPEAASFSWELSTMKVNVAGYKPTAKLTIDSRKISATALKKLEDKLYGTASTAPSLPTPDEVIALVK